MVTTAHQLLGTYRKLIVEDTLYGLNKLEPSNEAQRASEARKRSRKLFAGYLVSVATHPIGLQASASPYNCSQEYQLAYLIDMFKFTQAQLAQMLMEERRGNKSPGAAFKKVHSWRPELKLRVGPPLFGGDQSQEYLKNLSVRIYLFGTKNNRHRRGDTETVKQESPADGRAAAVKEQSTGGPVSGSSNLFHSLRRRRAPDRSTLVRPVQEMYFEMRFGRESPEAPYNQMILIEPTNSERPEAETPAGEGSEPSLGQHVEAVGLNVRRYYTDPQSAYILRLEFWLGGKAARMSPLRRLARRLVHSNLCRCDGAQASTASTYANENKLLYGYINLGLDQVPAYAVRRVLPIVSMRGQRLSSCEICLEFKNRRLGPTATASPADGPRPHDTGTRMQSSTANDFILNHLRLYANCVVYQINQLKLEPLMQRRASAPDAGVEVAEAQLTCGVTLDNLLYLPAHSLINQHRLQANLRHLEDQSLRRSALVLVLLALRNHSFETGAGVSGGQLVQLLLVSLIHNEYLSAHRLFEPKNMQEIEIFETESGAGDTSRELILDIENALIDELVAKFLGPNELRRDWLAPAPGAGLARSLTLASMRLVRQLIAHFKTNRVVNSNQRHVILKLEPRITQTLGQVLAGELNARMQTLLLAKAGERASPRSASRHRKSGAANPRDSPPVTTATQTPARDNAPAPASTSSWTQMWRQLEAIDHELALNWAPGGIASLGFDFSKLLMNSHSLRDQIKFRMDAYLATDDSPAR